MADENAVLAANEAFYRAFAGGDASAMEAIWAARSPVACIHPGWDALTDRQSVMESWQGILANPPPVSCGQAEAFLFGDTAFVICEEFILGGLLIATNYFVREDAAWKIVHHHAGQVDALPATEFDVEFDEYEDDDDDDDDEDDGPTPAVH